MTKHEYICKICEVVREKSDCAKRQVGAVFVNQDFEVLATGYNAPPRKFEHCDWNPVAKLGTCGSPCTRTIHAEQNAIVQAAKRGTALEDSSLYCTYIPCMTCARLLVNLKVQEVYAKEGNKDGGAEILKEAGIPIVSWKIKAWIR